MGDNLRTVPKHRSVEYIFIQAYHTDNVNLHEAENGFKMLGADE